MNNIDLVKQVLKENFNTDVSSFDNYSSGYAGYVYGTTIDLHGRNTEVIVKLTPAVIETPIEEASYNDRIYATRYSNFTPAYDVLKKHGIQIPVIYAQGKIQGDKDYHYIVMSKLKGESIREYLAYEDVSNPEELHTLIGKNFALVHAITRRYDGWVEQKTPNEIPWKEAFFSSFRTNLARAVQIDSWFKGRESDIYEYITNQEKTLLSPTEFVLSDIDGFQGIAHYEEDHWHFSGLIDIEDHHFTDQRFVLAGHELSLVYENRNLPPSFWKAYASIKSIPNDYEKTKSIFMLYYLLSWIAIPFENETIKDEEMQYILSKFHTLSSELLGR